VLALVGGERGGLEREREEMMKMEMKEKQGSGSLVSGTKRGERR